MKLKIDRQVWLRGEGSARSYLFRSHDAKLCCVGLYLRDLGVAEEDLEALKSACTVCNLPFGASWLAPARVSSPIAGELYETNDDPNIDPEVREQKIADLFARAGVEVEFHD